MIKTIDFIRVKMRLRDCGVYMLTLILKLLEGGLLLTGSLPL